MQSVIPVYKPIGATPLEIIGRLKKKFPEYANTTISYAGRLDPMAEGLLLLLVGNENKNRKSYEDLPKTYEFTVLFGVETDSYDILGKILSSHLKFDMRHLNFDILHSFFGKRTQAYPPYSSKAVLGKPLYWWARHNRLREITIPQHEIEIFNGQVNSIQTVTKEQLQQIIFEKLNKVNGDFRQDEIKKIWKEFFQETSLDIFPIITATVSCSSGTYIRTLAHDIGKKLQSGALTLAIKRIRVGDFTIKDAINLE